MRIRFETGKTERAFFRSFEEAEFAAKARRAAMESARILSLDQVKSLLEKAAPQPDLLATVLLGCFASLRPGEVTLMSLRSIDLERNRIDCGKDKNVRPANRRYVKIEPVLAAWLAPLGRRLVDDIAAGMKKQPVYNPSPFSPENKGLDAWIHRSRFRQRWEEMIRSAGFEVAPSDKKGVPRKPALPGEWTDDYLWNSYAAYHLARFKDDPSALALEVGLTPEELHARYHERVSLEAADSWWKLPPS
jgi:integrase